MSKRKPGDWWDQAWNPVTGCTPCCPACDNCWAQSFLTRFKQIHGGNDPREIICHTDRLEAPLHWKKPRRVFVANLSDLFHEEVSFEFIYRIYRIMDKAPRHTFFLLTKRPERCVDFVRNVYSFVPDHIWHGFTVWDKDSYFDALYYSRELGSRRNKFLSIEPLLGPIQNIATDAFKWIIVGGETGPKARPMQSKWVRSIRDQCVDAGVPFWFKQWGKHIPRDQAPGLLDDICWHQRPEDM